MPKSILFFICIFFSLNAIAQEIERSKSNLPEISEVRAILDNAKGWVLQDNGSWLSEKNTILQFSFEQNLSTNQMQKLGRQNFNQLELREVLIGDEQFIVFTIKYTGGYFEFPTLHENFHLTKNASYVVFPAGKLNEIMATINTFNEPVAINLEVFCSDDLVDYDKEKLTTQIAYNILRVKKMEETPKFTMILALMPTVVNGEKLFRFRYIELLNQEGIYQKYLLPVNKVRLFENSYFEVEYTSFTDFFGSIKAQKTDFNLLSPKNFNDFYNRGVLRYERKIYDDALSDFRNALRIKPDTESWHLYAMMGSTLHQLENYNAAIRSFEKALLLEPKSKEQQQSRINNYYNLGLSYLMLKNKEEACKNFQKAMSQGLTDKDAIKVIKRNCKGKNKAYK